MVSSEKSHSDNIIVKIKISFCGYIRHITQKRANHKNARNLYEIISVAKYQVKLFEFFQFEKYIFMRNSVQMFENGSNFDPDHRPNFQIWGLANGFALWKNGKNCVNQPFRSSQTKIQCTRSGCGPVAIISHGNIHEIVDVNYHIENVFIEKKMSSIYHYHFYADVYECICVTQVCDTAHILVFGFH